MYKCLMQNFESVTESHRVYNRVSTITILKSLILNDNMTLFRTKKHVNAILKGLIHVHKRSDIRRITIKTKK